MIAEIFGWFVFIFFTTAIAISVFYPLYLWKVKNIRTSKIYTIARVARIIFGVVIILTMGLFIYKPPSTNPSVLFGAIGGRLLLAYLFIKRWAPKPLS